MLQFSQDAFDVMLSVVCTINDSSSGEATGLFHWPVPTEVRYLTGRPRCGRRRLGGLAGHATGKTRGTACNVQGSRVLRTDVRPPFQELVEKIQAQTGMPYLVYLI